MVFMSLLKLQLTLIKVADIKVVADNRTSYPNQDIIYPVAHCPICSIAHKTIVFVQLLTMKINLPCHSQGRNP